MRSLLQRGHDPLFFITLHKCASTLFANHVLPASQKYQHCDYASRIFNGQPYTPPLDYSQKNTVYGPIRIHTDYTSEVPRHVIMPLLQSDLYPNMNALFLIRDPRDVLVSRFYSLRYTHASSENPISQSTISYLKKSSSTMAIDEYVLSQSQMIEQCYRLIHFLTQNCQQCTLLKYEDMIHDFESFYTQLDSSLDLPDATKDDIYQRSRPRGVEDISDHKRSGKTGGYLEKLQPHTIECLNNIYSQVLTDFDYPSTSS